MARNITELRKELHKDYVRGLISEKEYKQGLGYIKLANDINKGLKKNGS